MAQCIQCSHELTDDFGLVECPSCQTVLFIDMDGEVSISSDVQNEIDETPLVSEATVIEAESLEPQEEVFFETEQSFEPVIDEEEQVIESFESEDIVDEPVVSFDVSTAEGDEYNDVIEPENSLEEFVDEPSVVAPAVIEEDSNMDLSEFSNQVKETHGFLIYTLRFTGIDTANTREAFRFALSDPKFNWDAESLIQQIKDGSLEMVEIDAVKAAILINKVKSIEINCSWEQNNVYQN